MDMILDYKYPHRQENQGKPIKSPQELVINISPKDSEWRLGLITAGKRKDDSKKNIYMDYANNVRTFDWTDFYNKWDGEFYFDWLRNQFSQMADVVLIDTRTGVTEAGGVCNYQIANVVVMFSTASKQSLEGTYEVVKDLMNPKVQEIRGREVSVVIIPARVESGDKRSVQAFQSKFNKRFSRYTPESMKFTENQLWSLRIPYVPKYACQESTAALKDSKIYHKSVEELLDTLRKITFCLSRLAPKESAIRVAFPETWDFTDSGGFLLTSLDGNIITFEIEKNLGLEVIWLNLPPEAKKLAVCLSLFAPQPFEWDIVEEVMIVDTSDYQTKKTELAMLRDQELVKQNLLFKQKSQYGYSPSVKEFFATKAQSLEEYSEWQNNFCNIMLAKAELIGSSLSSLSADIVTAYISHIKEAVNILLRLRGERHPTVASAYNNLAYLYQDMGRYEEALPLYLQSLEIRLEQLGERHPAVADSYNNLATLYKALGKYGDALTYYQQSLPILLETLGDKHPHVATAYNNLAVIYQEIGTKDEALNLYQQSLDIRLEQLGEKHPDVATSYNNLAYLYQGMGRYEEAYEYYQKSIRIAEEALGNDHLLTQNFVSVYTNMLLDEPEDKILALFPPETHADFLAVKEKIKRQNNLK
jgi:tetratricopeptide (TPR) repeat protein